MLTLWKCDNGNVLTLPVDSLHLKRIRLELEETSVTHVTGSIKVINASKGPVLRSDPLSPMSKPSSEILLL